MGGSITGQGLQGLVLAQSAVRHHIFIIVFSVLTVLIVLIVIIVIIVIIVNTVIIVSIFIIVFLSDPGVPGVRSMGPVLSH